MLPYSKWYITNINIEFTLDNSDHFNPTMMNVEVFSSGKGQGEVLLFEKMSPREWKCNNTIALTNEVTLIARWDETENFGTVHLVKTELEKWNQNAGLHNQIIKEFMTEMEGPLLRLVFELATISPEENMAQRSDGDLSYYKKFIEDLSKNPEREFARVLEISDNMPQKPQLLNLIGYIFQQIFRHTRNIGDINNSIRAYDLAIPLFPANDLKFMEFLHDSGVSALEQYQVTGNLEDVDQAISKFEIVVQGTHGPKPAQLNTLGISLQSRFERTGDLTDISEAISSHEKAVRLTPEGHADMPSLLNNLGNSFLRRFKWTGDLNDISEAISSQEKAIQLTPESHADFPSWLNDLGISFLCCFDRTGELTNISDAISSQQRAIQLTPEGHADFPSQLNNLGISLQRRFECTGNITNISEAILSQQKAVQLTQEGHADMPSWLNNLGISLQSRFKHTGNLTDISEAISLQKKAVQLTPEGHADMAAQLNNLGNALQSCFKHTADLTDISEAISSHQKAVQFTPEGHASMASRLNNLGISLQSRFEYTGDLTDISEAISSQQKALQLTPDGHADMPAQLNSLGISLKSRFECAGDLTDISEAISSQQKAVQLTLEGHADMPSWLNNLGNSFLRRFECTGDLTDIAEAISSHQKAVQFTPEGHPSMAGWLNNLGNSLQSRFKHTGDLTNISEAISSQQKAVQLTPEGHADMPSWLNNLGNSFLRRFERTGDLTDISEAISSQQKAVQLTPEGHADMPVQLNNLGNSFLRHFKHTADLTNISEAISSHQKAVQFTPEGHASMAGQLNNLGISLQSRFEHTGDLTDITEAISSQQKAVQLTPEGHAEMPARLNSLGISLQSRFERIGDPTDISEAISSHQKAVHLTPKGHADMPSWLNSLGNSFICRFESTGDLTNISEAISSQQKAVQLTPEGHADMPRWLNNLGNSFLCRFEHTGNPADVRIAISKYRQSATYLSGPPSLRLYGAKQWARFSQRSDPSDSQILDAYHTTIHLISLVAGLEQTIQKRYTNLIDISELSSSAAAAAFRFEQYDLALQWLEQGRCIVWTQLNNLRTPLQDLRIHNPDVADEILRVSRALENASSRAEPAAATAETSMMKKMSIQDEATAHIKLGQEWDQLLTKVRAMPHFEDFLKPVSCSSLLKQIPNSGPVVVINIHKDHSDALALVSGIAEPLHISLHKFSYEKAENLRNCLKIHLRESGVRVRGSELDTRGMRHATSSVIKDILRELWTLVVKPILNGLGYSESPSNLSRIWWCVTGPLAFLPIHAAGIYTPTESSLGIYSTLSDFAVSSYTPTVRALAERAQSPQEINKEKMGLFMISQPDTPTLAPIPGTTKEVRLIEQLLKNRNLRHLCSESDAATVNQVIMNMDSYSCIHFACHAAQNTDEPLRSGFYLYDGRLELSSIIKEHLVGADLAFLSACQTCTGDEKLSEEAVHLAAGMLAAGYRGVVATMWSIKDLYGPKIAEEFYEHLLGHGADDKKGSERLSSDDAAHALHHATQKIRKTLGDSESSLLTWFPYVHFGL